jgi:hypothetical protein
MLTNKLRKCRACHLKWFPRGETAGECPACGGKDVGAAFELFHVGIVLIVLAGIAWVVPSMQGSSGGDRPVATALSSVVETKPAPVDVQRTPTAALPLSAVVKAKKLTVRVQRGPRKGHTVTLRRGDKVTILDRKDRRFLVRDRRGNQVYVSFDKLNLRQTTQTRRQYVQR